MLPFWMSELSIHHRRATGVKERNHGAYALGAVQGALDVPRLVRAAGTVWKMRPGERLEFQAAGMVGGEKPLPGFVVLHETPAA